MSAAEKIITFENQILAGSGKKGSLKPIENTNYYFLKAGGFNVPNRGGVSYTYNEYLQSCSKDDSEFMRRVNMGQMFGELGHPKQYYLEKLPDGRVVRTKITNVLEWIMRLKTVDDQNTFFHIRKVHIKPTGGLSDPVFVYIEATGDGCVWGDLFNQSMSNPDINSAVSIRTVIAPELNSRGERDVEYWTTFDGVLEQGMLFACKHLQAGLESFLSDSIKDNLISANDNGFEVSIDNVIDLFEREKENAGSAIAGTESFNEIGSLIEHLKQTTANRKEKSQIIHASGLELFL